MSVSSSAAAAGVVLTAEEERLQQAPVQEDAGAEFGRAMQQSQSLGSKHGATNGQSVLKSVSDGSHKHSSSHGHSSLLAAPSTSQPKRAHTVKAGSPTASASPQHSSYKIPFPHAQAVFHPQSVYLHSNSSPNQLDGLSAEDEIRLRAHTCMFMSKVGVAMNIGQLAVATASVYLQVFYTHYSFKAFDRFEIACACLFLAGKVEEKKIRIDHVISAYYPQRQIFDKEIAAVKGEPYLSRNIPNSESTEWDEFRNKIYDHETVLLDAIEYQFDIVHPYAFLRKFIENYIYSPLYANESEAFIANQLRSNGLMAQIAWNFINDSLRTTLCLRYAPSTICVVAIRLAMRHLISNKLLDTEPTKFGAPKDASSKPWHEELFGLNKQTMKKMQEEIMNCIEFVGKDNAQLVLDAHTKSRTRSNVPLPNVKNQIKMLHELQRRQASAKHQAQFTAAAAAAAKPNTNSEVKDDKHTSATSSSSSHHSDRKRHRSSDRSRKDDSRHSHSSSTRPPAAAMSPLPCPPSPFLDATAPNPKSWVPDMRPNRSSSSHHRSDRDRDRHRDRDRRDHKDKDKDQDHKSSEKRHRSRSRNRRSRSRSQQRRASKEKIHMDGKNEANFAHNGPANANGTAHNFRDTSSFASDPSHLSTIREESDSQSINSSQFHSHRSNSSVSASLTKSASSLSLNMHMPHSASRLHTSASMNQLNHHSSSGNGTNIDILAGDILHMSSSSGPSGSLTEKSEEDIMRDINRESRSLKQEKREDSAEVDESEERASKRQRIEESNSASADFDDLNASTDTIMAPADANNTVRPTTHHPLSHSSSHESHALVSMQSNVSTTCVADSVEMKLNESIAASMDAANQLSDSVMSQPTSSDKALDMMRTDSIEQKSAAMETVN